MKVQRGSRVTRLGWHWIIAGLAAFQFAITVSVSAIAASQPLRIVAFGDSLTAGLGLGFDDAFPAQLEAALQAKGYDIEIVNGGVSGDTASGGLARFDWTLGPVDGENNADGVILELGANDALRGIDPAVTRNALDQILARLAARETPVLLTGMLAPRNMGEVFAAAFDPIYPDLAGKYDVLLYPFFLDGIVGDPSLNQSDGLHPNAKGVAEIVRRVLPKAVELISLILELKTN